MSGQAFVVTSDDTLTLNGNVFTDFADGDITVISFPNMKADSKTGKNGNGIISQNQMGKNATMVLRLLRGSADDQFMQNLMLTADNNWVGQSLLSGTFVKMLGDGSGATNSDNYTLSGGYFEKNVEGKENVDGQTDQGVAIYNLKFITCTRAIG